MEALKRSVGGSAPKANASQKTAKRARKTSTGQKEMLMSIEGKKPAKARHAKKSTAGRHRKSA
jgi:DNA end-binding protein Ku